MPFRISQPTWNGSTSDREFRQALKDDTLQGPIISDGFGHLTFSIKKSIPEKTMTSAPTTRKVKRFRVKIGEQYATLDFNLHEKGALVRCRSILHCHTFKRHVDASYAIKRTNELQKAIREGMFPNWDRLAAVAYTEMPTVEEFQREE